MIRVENLSFTYFGNTEPSLINISLEIQDGRFILITGPSDCGKSTLIRCLNGLIPHFYGGTIKGKINMNGIDPFKTSTKDLCDKVGMVFQNPENQLIMTTVEEEITFGLENLGLAPEVIELRLNEILAKMHLDGFRERSISTLSGGEKQKVAIASILAMKPQIIILDEPTSELDPISANEILEILINLKKEENMTIIVVEHRLEKLIPVTDQWIIMNKNRIEENGTPESIIRKRTDFFGINLPISFRNYLKWKDSIPNLQAPLTREDTKTMIQQILNEINLFTTKNGKENQERETKRDLEQNNKDENAIIEIESLYVGYNSSNYVLNNINMKIWKGSFVFIIGRNGSGKTTLLKSIFGLKAYEKGKIFVRGTLVDSKNVSQNAKITSLIFQNPWIQFYLDTVYEELVIGLKNFGLKISEHSERIEETLDRFDLRKYEKRYPRYLSLGTQQRLALAAVLLWNPMVLLLDEPTHGMDYQQKRSFFELLNQYRENGLTVVLVTHDIESVLKYSDYVYMLNRGIISDQGTAQAVLSRSYQFLPDFFKEYQAFDFKEWIP